MSPSKGKRDAAAAAIAGAACGGCACVPGGLERRVRASSAAAADEAEAASRGYARMA